MTVASQVSEHYTHGALEQTILETLAAIGRDIDRLDIDDLGPVDEFHIGGRVATVALLEQLELAPGMQVIDVGSGLGGTARHLAARHGVRVSGIDLTVEYVHVARSLSERAGLGADTEFHHGDATALPFDTASFDAAVQLHVSMNIPDKEALFAEVRRVLRPGGQFGLYDIMRTGPGEIAFPVPWATEPQTSFLADVRTYRSLLEAAGLSVRHERNRRDFALEFFRALQATAEGGPPPIGLHILMGEQFPIKVGNMIDGMKRQVIAPIELVGVAG